MSNGKEQTQTENALYRGRFGQIRIYLGKFFRMFIYQNDWKLLPMAALIAGLVCFAAGSNLFVTMEGTLLGSFALACVCIWNGFFNSIQVVCRERDIVKREHRSGLHMSSYVAAHMIYQLFLCLLQSIVTMAVIYAAKVKIPEEGFITPWFVVDLMISLLLTTYAADMLSLWVSSLARTTTSAMTIMPFILIYQLLFSGGMVNLPKNSVIDSLKMTTIAHWGLRSICALGDYNGRPMISIWNNMLKAQHLKVGDWEPVWEVLTYIYEHDYVDAIQMKSAELNQSVEYARTAENILHCWGMLALIAFVCALLAMVALEFIDRDRR